MSSSQADPLWKLMGMLFRAHPWHGVAIGDDAPTVVTAYIEIVPADTIKYELEKVTGILQIDRPQRFSNICPVPYGLVPQTYCGQAVAELFIKRSGRSGIAGDGDPIDICVLTEKVISHSDILLQAAPIGGLSMLDGDEADDKIIAVMKDDIVYGSYEDVREVPSQVLERLRHYFLTYKQPPGAIRSKTEITEVYGRDEAHRVVRAAHEDYVSKFANIEEMLSGALRR